MIKSHKITPEWASHSLAHMSLLLEKKYFVNCISTITLDTGLHLYMKCTWKQMVKALVLIWWVCGAKLWRIYSFNNSYKHLTLFILSFAIV